MFPKQQIDGFEKYWRRRKPGSSTAVHYSSDVRIFFKWAQGFVERSEIPSSHGTCTLQVGVPSSHGIELAKHPSGRSPIFSWD